MSDEYTVINREVFSAVSDQDQLTNWFPDIAVLEVGRRKSIF